MRRILRSITARLQKTLPFVFTRRHRRMTLEGVMFVALTLIIGLAALNTGANLMYLVLSVMLCLLFLSGIISSLTLAGLKVKIGRAHV